MIDVSLFGWLAVTLASWLSIVLLITAFVAIAYIALCLLSAGAALAPVRETRTLGIAATICTFGVSVVGLRLVGPGGGLVDGLYFLGLSSGLAAAVGGASACLWLGLRRSARAVLEARGRRRAALAEDEQRRAAQAEKESRRLLDGEDLRADLDGAEAAVRRLRGGLSSLVDIRTELSDKLEALERDGAASSLLEECIRARDDATTKLDLAERVLDEAEGALFRLRCNQPVRRLVRRRPQSDAIDPSGAIGHEAARAKVERAEQRVSAFVRELESARSALQVLDEERPGDLDPDDDDDPLTRARAEIDAMASAYGAVLMRLEVVRMRLAAGAETRALAHAAGVLSERTRSAAIDGAEVEALVRDVARAEAGTRAVVDDETSARSLVEAVARSQAALERSDGSSLREICGAMREIG